MRVSKSLYSQAPSPGNEEHSSPEDSTKRSLMARSEEGCCKAMHKPHWVLLAVSLASFAQGVITDGIVNTSVTSIERRFQLTSTQSGAIVSTYFFTGIFVNLFVAYIGGRGHKSRWLSGGMFLYAVGALIYSLPHFISGTYDYNLSDEYSSLCTSGDGGDVTESSADDSPQSDSYYLYFFIVAQVALGLGSAPLYTLGIAYLDENVTVHNSGLYLGIFYAFATLGPAVGYIFGGVLLRFYTDFLEVSEVTISPEDPGWVGAWWLGMVIAAPVALSVALFLSIFPKELPGTAEIRSRKVSVAHKKGGDDILSTRADFGKKPMDFFIALKLLLRNPTMMFLNVVAICEAILIIGFAAYLPKLVETLFGQTASFSATVVGGSIIVGGCSGTFLGGWLVKKFRWDIRANLIFCIGVAVFGTVALLALLLRCPNQNLVDVSPSSSSMEEMLTSSCFTACGCDTQEHKPVCDEDLQLEYFSPCHAGCSVDLKNDTFGGCTCVTNSSFVSKGSCKAEACPQLYVFIPCLFAIILSGFLPFIPGLHASLRCVPESQRSLSLGLTNVIAKIFGSFPAPIIFGAIFDSTCVVWQTDEEGNRNGSCWIYDADKLSWRILILSEVIMISTALLTAAALYFYKPVEPSFDDEKQPENGVKLGDTALKM